MKYIGIFLCLIFFAFTAQAAEKPHPLSNQSCIGCHTEQASQWGKSDHAKSMAIASTETILANFDNVTVEHYGQKAFFFIKDNTYQVTISYGESTQTLPIKYTFGHFPLQQYIVETEPGKLQILPFAWDSRKQEEGGQRWYHNYSHEEIKPEDRLHWRQPLQNWNGMCADCHSDGLIRNYDQDKKTFNSQFDNINVGCLSCHGDMSAHGKSPSSRSVISDVMSIKHPTGKWLRSVSEKTAKWQGDTRDNSFMDTCFGCHSLRAPLTDGITPGKAFLDQFSPQLIAAPNYHADGQIKEEVYVYGSFLQSKMFEAGVNCLDCHDKHTMKVKAEGNGLCLQCHGAEVYNVKEHHQHNDNSDGAQCVNCHMPTNRYMGVDDRRDHSFKIPRPHISEKFNTPNACINCHEEKDNNWADEKVKTWFGQRNKLSVTRLDFIKLNAGDSINLENHFAIISDENLDVISRATALQLMSYTTQVLSTSFLKPYINHNEGLLRLSAAHAAKLLTPKERVVLLTPLLSDKYKAVRIAAARSLIDSHMLVKENVSIANVFAKAVKALNYSNEISGWRGEGRLNLGVNALQMNLTNKAEAAFLDAITVDPYMDTSYINLADLYRIQQQPIKVKETLLKGITNLPSAATIQYSYGLYLVRQKQLNEAVNYFKQAMLFDKANAQYLYTFTLALDGQGKTREGMELLKKEINGYNDKSQIRELGLYFAQKLKNQQAFIFFKNVR